MKKWLRITLIVIGIVFLFILLTFFGLSPYDATMFNIAMKTGNVEYCDNILDFWIVPGRGTQCVTLLAQKNNDSSICEKLKSINDLYISDCYALYAYYKNDESLCQESLCSKTLFDYCIKNGCSTIND